MVKYMIFCETALIYLVDNLVRYIDQGTLIGIISLDLSRAFIWSIMKF